MVSMFVNKRKFIISCIVTSAGFSGNAYADYCNGSQMTCAVAIKVTNKTANPAVGYGVKIWDNSDPSYSYDFKNLSIPSGETVETSQRSGSDSAIKYNERHCWWDAPDAICGTLSLTGQDLDTGEKFNLADAKIKHRDGNPFWNMDRAMDIHFQATNQKVSSSDTDRTPACLIEDDNGMAARANDWVGQNTLVPSIMEAGLTLCVDTGSGSRTDPETFIFKNVENSAQNLEASSKLYPKIFYDSGESSNYSSNFITGFHTEDIYYSRTDIGVKCSKYHFTLKTTPTMCSDLQSNSPAGSINSAQIVMEADSSLGTNRKFTLYFNSKIDQVNNGVDAQYTLKLVDNDPTAKYFQLGVPNNTLLCGYGVCKGTITYYPTGN